MRTQFSRLFFYVPLLLAVVTACSTQPPYVKPVSQKEKIRREVAIGNELAEQFESKLRFKKDTEISVYLRELAQALVGSSPEMSGATSGAWLVRDSGGKWRNYGLPGNRLYISVGILKRLQYENEVAGVIAIQLAHLLKRHLHNHIKMQMDLPKQFDEHQDLESSAFDGLLATLRSDYFRRIDFFGHGGVFSFTDDEEVDAMQTAVGILYKAGFDPRGLISVLELYAENVRSSPLELSTVTKLIETGRRQIAMFTPLRNPILKSQSFLKVQKRIQLL